MEKEKEFKIKNNVRKTIKAWVIKDNSYEFCIPCIPTKKKKIETLPFVIFESKKEAVKCLKLAEEIEDFKGELKVVPCEIKL